MAHHLRHPAEKGRKGQSQFLSLHWERQATHSRKNKKQVAGEKWPCIWCTKGCFSLANNILGVWSAFPTLYLVYWGLLFSCKLYSGSVVCLSKCKLQKNAVVPYAPIPLNPPFVHVGTKGPLGGMAYWCPKGLHDMMTDWTPLTTDWYTVWHFRPSISLSLYLTVLPYFPPAEHSKAEQ